MIVPLALGALAVLVPLVCLVLLLVCSPGRAAVVRTRQAASPLAHELPWWQILPDGTLIGVDLTYAAILELEGVDTDCRADDQLEGLQRSVHALLQTLPAGVQLQFHHITDQDHERFLGAYQAGARSTWPCAARLAADKVAAIRAARGLRRSRLYLVCALPPTRALGWRAVLGGTLGDHVSQHDHEQRSRRLRGVVQQVLAGLAGADVRGAWLEGDEAAALCYELLNPTRAQRVPPPSCEPGGSYQTARERLCFASTREDLDTLELDGRLLRVVTLRDLPTMTDPAMLEGLTVALPFACRVQLAVEVLDDQKALDQLKGKRDRANAHAALGQRRNQEAEAAAADVEDLIDKNLAASIRMVRVGLAVVLSVDARAADATERLEQQTAEVLRMMAGLHGAQGLVERYGQLDAWLGTLPGHAHHRNRWHLCTSENAAHLALCWQSWPGHRDAPVLVENARNYLVGLDPFADELDNPNAFMAGASGAGKSVTTNYLLMHLFAAGTKGLVIDVGGSYRRLLSLYGGDYIALDAAAGHSLNLFYEPADALGADGQLDPLRRRFMLAVLESLLCDHELPRLGHEQLAVLDAAIDALYAGAATAPTLSDLRRLLAAGTWDDEEDAQLARRMGKKLRRWTEGAYGRLLDRPSTVRLTADMAGFDLKGLPDEVRGPIVLILAGIIWNLVTRDPTEKKVVVFDEVWTLLGSPVAAELLEELYRTSRKYRCAILAISQSVDDFTGSSIATAVVNNAATTYLLRHRAGHDVIAETFHLNPRERAVFEGLEMRRGEYSELLVLAGRDHHFVARIVLTPLEYWIATTHPADQAVLAAIAAQHPHLPLSDQLALCAERFPRGAADVAVPAAAA